MKHLYTIHYQNERNETKQIPVSYGSKAVAERAARELRLRFLAKGYPRRVWIEATCLYESQEAKRANRAMQRFLSEHQVLAE